jgi:rare lipoprotein A
MIDLRTKFSGGIEGHFASTGNTSPLYSNDWTSEWRMVSLVKFATAGVFPRGPSTRICFAAAVSQLLVLSACTSTLPRAVERPNPTSATAPLKRGSAKTQLIDVGIASVSWYGPGFRERRTGAKARATGIDGTSIRKPELTASHPTLPFGSEVEVTDLQTMKKIIVRINDRGPYSKNRVLDLSYAAAASLNLTSDRTTPIVLKVLTDNVSIKKAGPYSLQVAAGLSESAADRALLLMNRKFPKLRWFKRVSAGSARLLTVRAGPFDTESEARAGLRMLTSGGIEARLLRRAPESAGAAQDELNTLTERRIGAVDSFVADATISASRTAILRELREHPERLKWNQEVLTGISTFVGDADHGTSVNNAEFEAGLSWRTQPVEEEHDDPTTTATPASRTPPRNRAAIQPVPAESQD